MNSQKTKDLVQKSKIIVIYECGCISGEPLRGKRGRFLPCPIHGKEVRGKLFLCKYCGTVFEMSTRVNKTVSCADCKVVHRADLASRRTLDSPPKPNLERKIDCKHYSDCLDIGGRLLEDPEACNNCRKYSCIDIEEQLILEVL